MIVITDNKELEEEIRQKIKDNNGYCPCALVRDRDTKCMCKQFREAINSGYKGPCHCGLYEVI